MRRFRAAILLSYLPTGTGSAIKSPYKIEYLWMRNSTFLTKGAFKNYVKSEAKKNRTHSKISHQ